MSMDSCTKCGELVDTDMDCQFYDFAYTAAKTYGGHCEDCRHEIYDGMPPAQQVEHEKRMYQ